MTKNETLDKPITPIETASKLPDRLSSGMKADEAVSRASHWWDRVGAPLARKQVKRKVNYDNLTDDIVVKSGILLGVPWEQLERRERMQVVKMWHNTFQQEEMGKLHDDRIVDPKLSKTVSMTLEQLNQIKAKHKAN